MKKKILIFRFIVLVSVLMGTNTFAQTYNSSFKFNYGVFLYNEANSQAIKQPFATSFSLGLQFQSNFNKAFTNSVGINVYRWNNSNAKNESINIQEMLFLRNNAKLFNRLKPQIGIGLGFEEKKSTVLAQNNFNQYLYVPVNIGFHTDLSEQIALGIFGELKYGVNVKDFSNGQIMPNNTAGLSLSYRFGRVREKKKFAPINWGEGAKESITLQNLKDYQDSVQMVKNGLNKPSMLKKLSTTKNSLKIEKDSLGSQKEDIIATVKRDTISSIKGGVSDSKDISITSIIKPSDTAKIMIQKQLDQKPINSGLQLSDFKIDTTVSVNNVTPSITQLNYNSTLDSLYRIQNTEPTQYSGSSYNELCLKTSNI